MKCALLNLYLVDEIGQSKQLIAQEFQAQIGASFLLADSHNSSTRAAYKAELDDNMGLLDALHTSSAWEGYSFAAAHMDNLPKFEPEEINTASVAD